MTFSKSRKQVLLLYTTTLFGVFLGILSSILNTHFLSPEDYGDVRYVQNIINFVASLLLFGYFLSGSRLLALSEDEKYSRRIRGSMIVILSIASAVLLLSTFVSFFFHSSKPHVAVLFLISLPVCFYPLFLNYVNTTAQGDNQIGRLSAARLLPALFYIPIAYFVYSQYGASSSKMILLQWGIATIILLSIILSTRPSFVNLKPIFKELHRENKSYGIQLYIGSLVMVATNYLAAIFLGIFNKDNTEVGFYTLAMTVTSPLATLPAIIGTTYFKKFAKEPRIPSRVMKFTILMTAGSCILFILLIKPIVIILYSERYAIVGTYASWLAVGYSIRGFGDMVNRYLGSHGQGKSIRNSSIFNGIFKIIGYTGLVYLWNTYGALLTNVLCSIIYCICLLYYYRMFTKMKEI